MEIFCNDLFIICILICSHTWAVFCDCQHESKSLQDGSQWEDPICGNCTCHSDEIRCDNIFCRGITCPNYRNKHLGESCTFSNKSCVDETGRHSHNDVWPSEIDCIVHHCDDGIRSSFILQCPSLVCPQGETLQVLPGECCPKCSPPHCSKSEMMNENVTGGNNSCPAGSLTRQTDTCYTKRIIEEKLRIHYQDSCVLCIGAQSSDRCYNRICPPCYDETMRSPCCDCNKGSCAPNCNQCLDSNPDYCVQCENPDDSLQNGTCLSVCDEGYFTNESRHCEACHLSCQTCFGNKDSQCLTCVSGSFLQKGRCVPSCSSRYYASNEYCFECDVSCLECEGTNKSDCLSCALRGQLFQDGYCVDDCKGHFYISDDYCLPCNETCARCLKNGTCQFCIEGLFLEDGLCLPECSPGYFEFLNAYCLPCHFECQQCFGPLPYQCLSCPYGQFLLGSTCVLDCGQGYFGDLGAGICRPCHSNCRTCLGGSAEDQCLTCTSSYLIPYIGTQFGPCEEKCPAHYFLHYSGACHVCHEDCYSCSGPDETDCISCNNSLSLKEGKCLPSCSAGHFSDDGTCYACHPTCSTCQGFKTSDCHTCAPGRTKQFGSCVSNCSEADFADVNGLCTSCDASCADCVLSITNDDDSVCYRCRNKQNHILLEKCVTECPSHFFLNSYNMCQECHFTCATCESHRHTSCVTCWKDNFLTPLGTCDQHCPQGYFPHDGVCEACDFNCHKCSSKITCLQCKGKYVLQSDVCALECSKHHYIDSISRECKGCSPECNECRGPSGVDCLSCTLGMLLQIGSCVQRCDEGFYKNGIICETCDLKCRTCSTLQNCTSCEIPMLLLDGECVDDCGSDKFPDYSTLQCEACGLSCTYCVSANECVLCKEGFYLHEDQCVNICPNNYFGDTNTRTCKKNIYVPHFSSNISLTVGIGKAALISSSVIDVHDEDSENVYVFVLELPTNGLLFNVDKYGRKVNVKVGESFTTKQLLDGWIFFKHMLGLPLKGKFVVKVNDGQFESNTLILPIQTVSRYPPSFQLLNDIIVSEFSSIKIDSQILMLTDRDNFEDVIVSIVKKPCFGNLTFLPRKENTSVTAETYLKNGLLYENFNSSLSKVDSFILQATDGYNSKLIELKVFILTPEKKDPFVVVNKPLIVESGSETTLNKNNLLVVSEKAKPLEIIFRIPNATLNSIGLFFNSSSNRQEALVEFTQDDINKERIVYLPLRNDTSKHTLHFNVSSKSNKLSAYEFIFDIEISKSISDSTFLIPEKKYEMIVLHQNNPAILSNDDLSLNLKGYSPADLLFTIVKGLNPNEGILVNRIRPNEKLKSFTQEDIDNFDIIYYPTLSEEDNDKLVFFEFIVTDNKTGIQLSPVQRFIFSMRSAADLTTPATYIDHETTVKVIQGQSVLLGAHVLSTIDHELPDDQLEVVLTRSPRHGTLVQRYNGYYLEIEEGDSFSYTSITNDVEYRHDVWHESQDSALLTITSGKLSSLNRIIFNIVPEDHDSPVILDSTTLMATVLEGSHLDIQRNHLAFTDLISGDEDILFTLLNTPKYGTILKKNEDDYHVLKLHETFTQQDINDLQIRYTAYTGLGDDIVRDFIYLNVSDGSGNIQSNQVLTMKVKPQQKFPPVVKITSDVQVEEGGYAVIEPHVISVYDPDSPLIDLNVEIVRQPEFGFVESSKPILGAEKSLDGIPISSFSYTDVLGGFIKYRQGSHTEVEPVKDTMYIQITDGHLSSESHLINITIRPINDEAPEVFPGIVNITHGGYAKILNSTLLIIDADTKPIDLLITLDFQPRNGELKKLKHSNPNFEDAISVSDKTHFTFQDVIDGLIVYVHKNVKNIENDSLSLTVTDSIHSVSFSIVVIVTKTDREVPILFINRGMQITPGSMNRITNQHLSASDIDSDNNILVYTITENPSSGRLVLIDTDMNTEPTSITNRNFTTLQSFTQRDIDGGHVAYLHSNGKPTGSQYFKFNIKDSNNNVLLDQKFIITITEDTFPPVVVKNTGLKVMEKSYAFITFEELFAIDEHSDTSALEYAVTEGPHFGYLDFKDNQGFSISKFFASDLIAGRMRYVHNSTLRNSLDNFTFRVSEGKNYAVQTFYVWILPQNNVISYVKINNLNVMEGSSKLISEFEIDILNKSTQDSMIIFQIVDLPNYGSLLSANGSRVLHFSMEDILSGKISYQHDGSDTLIDRFSFTVFDVVKQKFIHTTLNATFDSKQETLVLHIDVQKIDDAFPVLSVNKKLLLKKANGLYYNTISTDVLFTDDRDTEAADINYVITVQPRFGTLQLTTPPGVKISHFTQTDVNEKRLQYVLTNDDLESVEDKFMFSVEDSGKNKISGNIFSIHWNRIAFLSSKYNVSELDGTFKIPIKRFGDLDTKVKAYCDIENDMRTSTKSYKGKAPLEAFFGEGDIESHCIFEILNNNRYEGKKSFRIHLKSDVALLGVSSTVIIDVYDTEDEPFIRFGQSWFSVNETTNILMIPVTREGDSSKPLSVSCTTSDGTATASNTSSLASGADFKKRAQNYDSLITFPPRVNESICEIRIIDDSLFEESEQFHVILSDPRPFGRLGHLSEALVTILGPNDVPLVRLSEKEITFSENRRYVSATVTRAGPDLSRLCTVWCGLRYSHLSNIEDAHALVQVTFLPRQKTTECTLTLLAESHITDTEIESLSIFLQSPVGCYLSDDSAIVIPFTNQDLQETIIEFGASDVKVLENSSFVEIPILRSGNSRQFNSIYCVTRDDTAKAGFDFEGRYLRSNRSLVFFESGQKNAFCSVKIIDDFFYEGKEKFKVELVPFTATGLQKYTLGNTNSITIEIDDPEDATIIEFESNTCVVEPENSLNNSVTASIPIIRYGDLKHNSKIRISTIDGSATSGYDYYARSKVLTFVPGERRRIFEVEILYNPLRKWNLSFTVILGPHDTVNADIGNRSRVSVLIPKIRSTENLILPTIPIVISLWFYDNVEEGLKSNPKPGYPLICVTPCDRNYPEFPTTGSLCRESGLNASLIEYAWFTAYPLNEETMSPFNKIIDSTLFTAVNHKVLDSIYFNPNVAVKCSVRPKDSKGHLGIPLISNSVKIDSATGYCSSGRTLPFSHNNIHSQSPTASINYANSSDALHPNKLHIHVEISHQDGMLPLISTYPIHNIQLLLSQSMYRQQHTCSNLIQSTELGNNLGFLKSLNPKKQELLSSMPQGAKNCNDLSLILYQHLDLRKCKWTFDAWFSMSELVELCGGVVTSGLKSRDSDKTFVTIQLPLHISYVFAAVPSGWTSIEHHTHLEFSFHYDAFLWKSGSHTGKRFGATLLVSRMGTDDAGHLFFEFKTTARFFGKFVLEHHTLPGLRSKVIPPTNLNVDFNLKMIWSEQTFEGPTQFWKATSNYNLKDFSGHYVVELIPCEAILVERNTGFSGILQNCIAQAPERFDLPLTFQQTDNPAPVSYALDTFFQLFNDENLFLLNPFENYESFPYLEYKGTFTKGQSVLGRVFWNPEQDLESAYQLRIDEVILCTGKGQHMPMYDPTGTVFGKGPQFGCIKSSNDLQHKFILLNRNNQDATDKNIQGVNFESQFIQDSPQFQNLSKVAGVDGFIFKIDPLYEINSNNQWFIQVIYSIKPQSNRNRQKRSSILYSQVVDAKDQASRIKKIEISKNPSDSNNLTMQNRTLEIHHFLYFASILVVAMVILTLIKLKKQHSEETSEREAALRSYITWTVSSEVKQRCKTQESFQFFQSHKVQADQVRDFFPKHNSNFLHHIETEI